MRTHKLKHTLGEVNLSKNKSVLCLRSDAMSSTDDNIDSANSENWSRDCSEASNGKCALIVTPEIIIYIEIVTLELFWLMGRD